MQNYCSISIARPGLVNLKRLDLSRLAGASWIQGALSIASVGLWATGQVPHHS